MLEEGICCKLELFETDYWELSEKEIDDSTVNMIEQFVCHMYGYKKQTSFHQVLPLVFESKYKPKQNGQPLDSIKNIDPKTISTFGRMLLEQIKTTCYILRLYKTVVYQNSWNLDASVGCWTLDTGV